MENSKEIKRLEISLALLMIFIPLILKFIEGKEFRSSISNYAYSDVSQLFVLLLSLAGAMFLYNGIGYKRHWYNSFLGVSLFGVVLFPHLDFPIMHYFFAALFFVGSILSIALSSNIAFRNFKFLVSGITTLILIAHFCFGLLSLLITEWICIIPFSLHFILKSIYKS